MICTWVRDRSRVFKLEAVVGWEWETLYTTYPPKLDSFVKFLKVRLTDGNSVGFYRPDAEKIEAFLIAQGVGIVDPLKPPEPEVYTSAPEGT